MKLASAQLQRHLNSGKLAPLYLVATDELLLQQEAASDIRAAITRAGFTERERILVENGAEWGDTLYATAHNRSLFSNKRLLELDLRQTKFSASSSKALQAYVSNPAKDTILLILAAKLDAKTEQSAWFRACEKAGVALTIWPINREALPQWILQRAQHLKLSLTLKGAEWLAQQTEGNVLAAAQELEKLVLFQGQQSEIAVDDLLRRMVTRNTRFDIFHLADSALAGETARTRQIYASLLATGTEPLLILWSLTREVRTLAHLLAPHNAGMPRNLLLDKFYIRDKRKPLFHAALQRHTRTRCEQLLQTAAAIDRMIKGAERGNVTVTLEQLALGIAGMSGTIALSI